MAFMNSSLAHQCVNVCIVLYSLTSARTHLSQCLRTAAECGYPLICQDASADNVRGRDKVRGSECGLLLRRSEAGKAEQIGQTRARRDERSMRCNDKKK